jgi:hypothetical protein
MAHFTIRSCMRATIVNVIAVSAGLLGVVTTAPDAHADETAYLVNVTVRPDYNVASADDALTYGRGVCAPALIWQLRNSAAQYGPSPWRPPEGAS